VKIALIAAFCLALAPAAFAKGKSKMHCMKADGTEDTASTTKKACKKAGGKWEKMAAMGTPAPAK